jgi:hypothetical protein
MRAGKRAARREVHKHIDFTEGIEQKITPPKDKSRGFYDFRGFYKQ